MSEFGSDWELVRLISLLTDLVTFIYIGACIWFSYQCEQTFLPSNLSLSLFFLYFFLALQYFSPRSTRCFNLITPNTNIARERHVNSTSGTKSHGMTKCMHVTENKKSNSTERIFHLAFLPLFHCIEFLYFYSSMGFRLMFKIWPCVHIMYRPMHYWTEILPTSMRWGGLRFH